MQRQLWSALACALGASCALAAAAPMPVIYPAKNQSAAQTDRDKLACYDWSRTQSGFDPLQPPPAPMAAAQSAAAPAPKSPDGSLVKGAAGGAAIAELTKGDIGQGAAIGLLGAGARERMKEQQAKQARQQKAAQQQQQQQAQQQAALAQGKAQFDRGFAACMEARGYVVK
jgi:predicted lipid-binding transport protein (Tim44 family)